MVPPMRYTLPGVVLLVAGLGLLSWAGPVVLEATGPAYSHAVQPVEESVVPENEAVRPLSNFSEPAREAVLAALETDGVHETDEPAPDLRYPGDTVTARNTYYVRHEGELYRLTTMGEGPAAGLAVAIGLPVGGVGVVLAGAGGAVLWAGRGRGEPAS